MPESLFLRATLLKKRLWHKCFPVNFAKFLRTPISIKHIWWLLLNEKKADFRPFQIGQPVVFKTRSGKVLRVVIHFNYLGSWIASSEEVDCQQETQNKIVSRGRSSFLN